MKNLAVSTVVAYLTFLIVPRLSDALDNVTTDNDDQPYYNDDYDTNCTNHCPWDVNKQNAEENIRQMIEDIIPGPSKWVLICMHTIVFMVGVIGNTLVCLAVYRNHSMRTVTNYFIVNLAVADLLVLLICLPPSVVWDVTETWFLGLTLCRIVPYLQVSIYLRVFISVLYSWRCFRVRNELPNRSQRTYIYILYRAQQKHIQLLN